MGINFDRRMNDIENELSAAARYPFVGSVPAAAKVIMGVAQTIAALAYGFFALMPAAIHKDFSYLDRSWSHIKHGCANIAAGLLEAIPFVGTGMYMQRDWNKAKVSSSQPPYTTTGHEDKFYPYKSLVQYDTHTVTPS